nr:hypothetical protein BgiMline_012179 [Biomphalaria glabrata]
MLKAITTLSISISISVSISISITNPTSQRPEIFKKDNRRNRHVFELATSENAGGRMFPLKQNNRLSRR